MSHCRLRERKLPRSQAGDWVLLASDGLLADGTDWVAQQLALAARTGQSPQQLARQLVYAARQRAENHRPDDTTAAVLVLERNVG